MSMIDDRKRIECIPNPSSILANTTSKKTEGTLTCNKRPDSKKMDIRKIFRYGKSDKHNSIEGKLDNDGGFLAVSYKIPEKTQPQFENLTLPMDDNEYCVSTPKSSSALF